MQGFVCVGLSLPLLSVVVPQGFASNVSVCGVRVSGGSSRSRKESQRQTQSCGLLSEEFYLLLGFMGLERRLPLRHRLHCSL